MMSMMMDSCNVMRGSKTGLETRIRLSYCPALLDVDGDSCHHIHNAAKVFVEPFANHLEGLFMDLHTDHQWSPDQVTVVVDTHTLHCKLVIIMNLYDIFSFLALFLQMFNFSVVIFIARLCT